ncbi:MAG: 3'(2'),5'-bisphosphate nucleotidase CysQ [Cocleimonas sp.]
MNPEQLKQLLPEVLRIAKQAGEKIMDVYAVGFDIQIKADKSPVTTADLAANDVIVEGLNTLLPLFPILSEESEHLPFEVRAARETYWLVDPLDGTKEFINRHDSFTVNIALIHKNKSILGVIYAPALGVSYYACKGHGSYKETSKIAVHKISARKIPSKAVFAGSRAHPGKTLAAFLENYKKDHGDYDLVSMGSSLKMCMVAEGTVDLYPRLWGTSEWDTAAAHCIVEEAGGQLVKIDMSPLYYNSKDALLNPYFFTIGDNSVDWTRYLPDGLEENT